MSRFSLRISLGFLKDQLGSLILTCLLLVPGKSLKKKIVTFIAEKIRRGLFSTWQNFLVFSWWTPIAFNF